MGFHVPPTPISPRGIDDTIHVQNIPWNLFRSCQLEHSRTEFVVDEIIVSELAGRFIHCVAPEQVLNDFRFADISHRDDLDIVFFQCKVIQVPTNLAQAHNADTDFPVTHLATSAEIKLPGLLLFYTRGLEKSINFVTSEFNTEDGLLSPIMASAYDSL
jgi:hypothetical protein